MRRKPATFDAHKSLRPLRPSSSMGKVPSKPPLQLPAWDSTVNDLSVHKLTRAQQLNRKASVISKNRTKARQEWLQQQQSLAQDPLLERQLIDKLKPPRKPKQEHKKVNYPYYHQRRLYEREHASPSPRKEAAENANPNGKLSQEAPRLRGQAGQIKFTPATAASPPKEEPKQQSNPNTEVMDLITLLNGKKKDDPRPECPPMSEEAELDRFRSKYLPDQEQPERDYLDVSENLKNLQKLKQELSQPYGSSAPDHSPLDPLLQKYGLEIDKEPDGFMSLLPQTKRDPLPLQGLTQGIPLTNNIIASKMYSAQPEPTPPPQHFASFDNQETMRPFPNVSEVPPSAMPSFPSDPYQHSYGYDGYIPQPKGVEETPIVGRVVTGRECGGPTLRVNAAEEEEAAKLKRMQELFFSAQEEANAMASGMRWMEGAVQNPVKMDIMGNVGGHEMFEEDIPEEPRQYAVEQFGRVHTAGAATSSVSLRSHMTQFY